MFELRYWPRSQTGQNQVEHRHAIFGSQRPQNFVEACCLIREARLKTLSNDALLMSSHVLVVIQQQRQ